jgi:hypothetical protein
MARRSRIAGVSLTNNPMRLRTFVLLATTACAPQRQPLAAAVISSLSASMRVAADSVSPGDTVAIEVTISNRGTDVVNACFGPGFSVTFRDGSEAEGITRTVDHNGCRAPLKLKPGGSGSYQYRWRVPSLRSGQATVQGEVEIVNPSACMNLGFGDVCRSTWLRVSAGPPVTVR